MSGSALALDTEQRIIESRNIVKAFAGELKGALNSALKQTGPMHENKLCAELVPHIAGKYSQQTGWTIGLTSLKPRNRKNTPDDWETKVLQRFEQQKIAGTPIAKLEYSEVVTINQRANFRYMKAIPTRAKPCLACHGENINSEVLATIKRKYPGDLATGFKAGDIRGAFTLSLPI